jgi:hypothetical protein
MQTVITIIERGRGPELSTCRVTVQDLLPYLQEGCAYEEINRWIPVLTREDLAVVEQYVRDHYDEVLETERRIRERNAARKNSPEVERILQDGRANRLARMHKLRHSQPNGEGK